MSISLSIRRLPLQARIHSTSSSPTLLSSTLLNNSNPTASLPLVLTDKPLHLLDPHLLRLVASSPWLGAAV
ncbi:unnamed protein product [Aureobasidium uvarum]|uniref:Uncharacterized protein n=1 Tax=Aureobasidium uvarum TaxID=2773716 RepID=A0A9N8KI98_9PEZI|nr:unnamed protein product [Aureobasidium uvarum]